jgi:hypothetical protein
MYDEDSYSALAPSKRSRFVVSGDNEPYCDKVTKYYKKNKRSSIRFFEEEDE